MNGRSVGGHQRVELAKSVCDGPTIKTGNERPCAGAAAVHRAGKAYQSGYVIAELMGDLLDIERQEAGACAPGYSWPMRR
jgi:hypothetical protein